MQANPSVSTSLTILDTDIRADEHGRFCLNDLHIACGGAIKHKPGQWMRHDSFKGLVAERDARNLTEPSVVVKRGRGGGTYAHESIACCYVEWIGGKWAEDFLRRRSNVMVLKARPPEFAFGEQIVERLFAGYTIIRQFPVFGGRFRIDWYIPELRLAVEFDEKHHAAPAKAAADAARQAEIEAALGCRFLRYKHED